MRIFPRVLLPALTLLTASIAGASDFTFLVPVTIQNVPPDSSVRVSCVVSRNPVDAPTMSAMGEGFTDRPVGGSMTGQVTVEVNASPAGSAGLARAFYCTATLSGGRPPGGGGGGWSLGPSGVTADMFSRVTGRVLREWHAMVQGPIR